MSCLSSLVGKPSWSLWFKGEWELARSSCLEVAKFQLNPIQTRLRSKGEFISLPVIRTKISSGPFFFLNLNFSLCISFLFLAWLISGVENRLFGRSAPYTYTSMTSVAKARSYWLHFEKPQGSALSRGVIGSTRAMCQFPWKVPVSVSTQ